MIKTEVYRFSEFTFKSTLAMVEGNAEIRSYIPEEWFKSKRGSRDYLWLIMSSKKFDYVS